MVSPRYRKNRENVRKSKEGYVREPMQMMKGLGVERIGDNRSLRNKGWYLIISPISLQVWVWRSYGVCLGNGGGWWMCLSLTKKTRKQGDLVLFGSKSGLPHRVGEKVRSVMGWQLQNKSKLH